jgi:hypothetical protein
MADMCNIISLLENSFMIVCDLESDDASVAKVYSVVSELITFIEDPVNGMECDSLKSIEKNRAAIMRERVILTINYVIQMAFVLTLDWRTRGAKRSPYSRG